MDPSLESVRAFWDAAACGEVYAQGDTLEAQFQAHADARYDLEPYIPPFARFEEALAKQVLEIGVGMGADHVRLSEGKPQLLVGIDLTSRAIDWTSKRLASRGAPTDLMVASAEALPFPGDRFDIIYSWGVLHHTPDTQAAFDEVYRVLRPGGVARIMIYHRPSIVGFLLWLRYALISAHPNRSMEEIYATCMESPGTKGYTLDEARTLLSAFVTTDMRVQLSFGDLLLGQVGQRHRGAALTLAKKFWPRRAIERLLPRCGLMLLIEAVK